MHFQMLGGLRLPLSLQTLHYLTQPAELPPPPQTAQITNLPTLLRCSDTPPPLAPPPLPLLLLLPLLVAPSSPQKSSKPAFTCCPGAFCLDTRKLNSPPQHSRISAETRLHLFESEAFSLFICRAATQVSKLCKSLIKRIAVTGRVQLGRTR